MNLKSNQIRLIAFDLDGTLLNAAKVLTPRNKAALKRAAEKGIFIVPLYNCSSDEEDEYRLLNVTKDLLDKSMSEGGSEEMKALLSKRLDELFNEDIVEYFGTDPVTGEDNVTQEDVDACIDALAKGDSSCIMGEDFYWGDVEDLIIKL